MDTISRIAGTPLTRRSRAAAGSRWGSSRWGGLGGVGLGGVGRRSWQRLAGLLILWQTRLRDREALHAMSPAQLMDVGLSREAALREAEKPFWRR